MLTYVSFRAHVKIASSIVSYRIVAAAVYRSLDHSSGLDRPVGALSVCTGNSF